MLLVEGFEVLYFLHVLVDSALEAFVLFLEVGGVEGHGVKVMMSRLFY